MATNAMTDQELLDYYESISGEKFVPSAPVEQKKEVQDITQPSAPSAILPESTPPESDIDLIKKAEKLGLSDYYKTLDTEEKPPHEYLTFLETGDLKQKDGKTPFGIGEIAARAVRAGASGIATEAVSEPYFGAFGAAEQMGGGELLDLIFSHPGIDTPGKIKLLQKYQDAYAKDLARQREYKEEYPTASIVSEGLGMALGLGKLGAAGKAGELAIKPGYEALSKAAPGLISAEGTAAERIITPLAKLGIGKEIPEATLKQSMGQMLKGAAVQSAAMEAGKEVAKTTAGAEGTVSDQIKNIAIATASAPIFAGAMVPVVLGGSYAAGVAKQGFKKAALSKPAKHMYNYLFGPSVRSQEKFLEVERDLEKMASTDDIKQFYESMRTYILEKKDWSEVELKRAEQIMEGIYNRQPHVKAEAKREVESLAQQKKDALATLRVMIQDIQEQSKIAIAGEEGRIQKMGKVVDLTPHAENLMQNLKLFREQLFGQSKAAVELIHPDTTVTADQLIELYRNQIKKLSIQGLEEGTALGDTNQEAIRMLQNKIEYIKERFTTGAGGVRVLRGEAVKQAVKDLQKDFEKPPFADFNASYDDAINSVSGGLNQLLKADNPMYAKAMEPVADGFKLLNNFRPIVGSKDANRAYELAKLRYKMAGNDKVYEEQFRALAKALGDSSILDGIDELRVAKMAGTPEARALEIQNSTILQKARMQESLLRATKSQQFAQELLMKHPNDPNVKEIVSLWNSYSEILDPRNIKAAQDKAISGFAESEIMPQAMEEDAARKIANKYKAISKAFQYEEPGNLVEKFIRNYRKDQMTEAAAKVVDTISNLDPTEFSEFFKTINLKDPAEFRKLVDLIRIQKDIDTPNIQGSRRVVFVKAVMSAILGSGSGGAAQMVFADGWATGAALGATMGMAFDNYGPKIAQSWLRNINRIEGVPTYKKMLQSFPMVPDDSLRTILASEMASYVSGTKPEAYSHVSADMVPFLAQDVYASDMSPLKKAKITNELSKTGSIKGEYLIALTLDGIGQTGKQKPIAARLIEAEKPKQLKQDAPDILKELSKKGKQ